MPRTRIERIAREEKPVTADTALRLGKFFKTGAAFWMNIQARFDLETAEDVLARRSRRLRPTRRREQVARMSKAICGDRHNRNPDIAPLIRATLAVAPAVLRRT